MSADNGKVLQGTDSFVRRHIGPRPEDGLKMLEALGLAGMDALIEKTVPASIRTPVPLDIGDAKSEYEVLRLLRGLASRNAIFRSFIGMGYSGCITPAVIQRNILENPGWYTQYTPYQSEIAQGRLEALLNFQTMIADLTGLKAANASLLDEGTAAAEAMSMSYSLGKTDGNVFFVSEQCYAQTIAVVRTRAEIRVSNWQLEITRHSIFQRVYSALSFNIRRATGMFMTIPILCGARTRQGRWLRWPQTFLP